MEYKKIYLFGKQKSKGSFDDFYDTSKYSTLEEAYNANDYVQCNFVQDEKGIIYIEAFNVQNNNKRKYHELIYQRCICGLDVSDDNAACELAVSLF